MGAETVMGSAVYKAFLNEPIESVCEGDSAGFEGVDESAFHKAEEKQMTSSSDT